MADFHDHGAKFTVLELEFFAEDEIVTIVPNFSLPHNATMECLGGEFGPFRPNMPLEVPLWMALALHRWKRCSVQAPDWMKPDNLQEVLDEERRLRNAFQELPFHYIEVCNIHVHGICLPCQLPHRSISTLMWVPGSSPCHGALSECFAFLQVAMLLLREAKDTFGEDLYRVQTLVEQIRKVRKTKIDAGLRMLDRPMTVKMNNLSSMECNMIRPFFLGSLDRYNRHAQMDVPEPLTDTGAAERPQSESQPMLPRQLRRQAGAA